MNSGYGYPTKIVKFTEIQTITCRYRSSLLVQTPHVVGFFCSNFAAIYNFFSLRQSLRIKLCRNSDFFFVAAKFGDSGIQEEARFEGIACTRKTARPEQGLAVFMYPESVPVPKNRLFETVCQSLRENLLKTVTLASLSTAAMAAFTDVLPSPI